jgi:prophage antirepressor-like protein
METNLQVFYNEEVNATIRSKVINNECWFVGKDVCKALNFGNHKDALSRLDSDERYGVGITDPMGRPQEVTAINESGLYHLIFISRKSEARSFRKWVTNEVLPTIRRNGQYRIKGEAECTQEQQQRKRLPLPKYRPFFDEWKQRVKPYISRDELEAVADNMEVRYSHVRKVYAGTSVSERIVR